MIKNAKTDSNFIKNLNLDKDYRQQESTAESAADGARHKAERKPLMATTPSSAAIWGVLIGSAILASVTFLLLN